jgi:hypothetical protein
MKGYIKLYNKFVTLICNEFKTILGNTPKIIVGISKVNKSINSLLSISLIGFK